MMRKKRRNDNRCASFLIKCKIKPVENCKCKLDTCTVEIS